MPTDGTPAAKLIADELSRKQVEALEANCEEFGIPIYSLGSERQGIVHVIGPELGATQPGMTIVCGDSHTATHGAFGAFAMGIGTSEVEHVLATQCLVQRKPRSMRVLYGGELGEGVTAKDLILATIGRLGVGGMQGHAVEYAGAPIEAMTMENRLTVCNMTIEGGGKAGMIAPDETTYEYMRGRPGVPKDFEAAVQRWRELPSDEGASFDREIEIDAGELSPMVTWGTNPGMVVEVTGEVPDPAALDAPADREAAERALAYMDLRPGTPMQEVRPERVFIGSCTNSRISDLREAASMVEGRRVADSVRAMVVPGSAQVKSQAEEEGLNEVFESAGFEWRGAGCSMCLGMNPDILQPGERCASTSNRNFEGRQGAGGRTHLVSPRMAAAAAIEGHFVDIREWALMPMDPVEIVEGQVAVLDRADVDTDQIIPKQFLKRIERTGFGEFLFYDWFRSGEIELEPHPILVTGRNFGSGSSREHAVWALKDYGFDAVIAPSFSDIFYSNCTKNGLLPIVLDEEHCRAVAGSGEARIDLDDQTVNCAAGVFQFEIDEQIKHRLVNGLDDVAMTLERGDAIDRFEASGGADRGPITTAL